MPMGLGVYIRRQRELVGISQAALARAIGIKDRSYITQIESGRTKLPGHEVRVKLAAALGVREADLLIAAGELTEPGTVAPGPSPEVAMLLRDLEALSDRNLEVIRTVVRGLLDHQEPEIYSNGDGHERGEEASHELRNGVGGSVLVGV